MNYRDDGYEHGGYQEAQDPEPAEGFRDGLREGESEFDDAIIMTVDDAKDRLTEEGFMRLIGGETE